MLLHLSSMDAVSSTGSWKSNSKGDLGRGKMHGPPKRFTSGACPSGAALIILFTVDVYARARTRSFANINSLRASRLAVGLVSFVSAIA
jgi:hypothetical protein